MSEKKEKNPLLIAMKIKALMFISFLVFLGFIYWSLGRNSRKWELHGAASSKGNIAVVEIKGPILDVDQLLKWIRTLKTDKKIKGVLLRVDSPGGAVGPSQELYETLKSLDKIKPVVASFGSVAASGGYYIALAARRIVSNPGTITGSIGVIMGFADFSELFKWAKVRPEVMKAGKFKDIGQPHRPITAEERAKIQSTLDDVHLQFKEAITERRKMPLPVVDTLADGRFYSGREALKANLVDALGGFDVALDLLVKEAALKEEPKLVYQPKDYQMFFERFIEGAAQGVVKGVLPHIQGSTFENSPSVQYR